MISGNPIPERRKDPRLENNIPVKIFHEDGDLVTETKNVSRSGAYCRINKYIEPMTKLKISLLLPTRKNGKNLTRKIAFQGVVVRIEPMSDQKTYNVAIFFNDISQRDAECINDYVHSYLENTQGS